MLEPSLATYTLPVSGLTSIPRNIAQVIHNINQQKHDLEAREAKLLELGPLIPSARQLQGYGIGIDEFLPWIETVHEKAEAEKIDVKSAAYNVVQELRLYRQPGGLQKQYQLTTQQLAVLNTFTAQKQQAITTLMNLQLAGFSEKEIMELIGLVNRWNKQWSGMGTLPRPRSW